MKDFTSVNLPAIFKYFIACFLCCVAASFITVSGTNAVVSSSIVGIVVSVIAITLEDATRISWAGFAGSFAGMTAPSFINNYFFTKSSFGSLIAGILVLALIAASLYLISEIASVLFRKNFFDGYGGRLGMIAFISVILYIACNPTVEFWPLIISHTAFDAFLNKPLILLSIPSALLASLVSMEIKNAFSSLNDNYKVLSVAITGVVGGVLIPKIPLVGSELTAAWYAGSFVGMSSYFVLSLRRHYVYSGLLTGVVFIFSSNLFSGVGGKLGVIAFMSVLTVKNVRSLMHRVKWKISQMKTGLAYQDENSEIDEIFGQQVANLVMSTRDENADIFEMKKFGSAQAVHSDKPSLFNRQLLIDSVLNYNLMNSQIQEIMIFVENLGIKRWLYLQNEFGRFASICHHGVSAETVDACTFDDASRFIEILNNERRIIVFGKREVEHSLFRSRFSDEELSRAAALTVFPVFENAALLGFFFLLEDFDDTTISAVNSQLLRRYYEEQAGAE